LEHHKIEPEYELRNGINLRDDKASAGALAYAMLELVTVDMSRQFVGDMDIWSGMREGVL
jgi:hypothetical protein